LQLFLLSLDKKTMTEDTDCILFSATYWKTGIYKISQIALNQEIEACHPAEMLAQALLVRKSGTIWVLSYIKI